MTLKHSLSISLIAFSLIAPASVQAASPVRTITVEQARGRSNQLPTILVWTGSGTNLSFIPTGEAIQRVWLDDPSRITLDFDAPLCQGREGRSCGKASTSVIHLRRIRPLNWAGLPQA